MTFKNKELCKIRTITTFLSLTKSKDKWEEEIQKAPLSLLVPIFGLLGSLLIFNEQIGSEKIIAGVLIMTGLLISTFSHHIKGVI